MRFGDSSPSRIESALQSGGVGIDLGFVRIRVRADVPALAPKLKLVYAQFPFESSDGFFDVTASLERAHGLRRHAFPQVNFVVDGTTPFDPFPIDTDLPLLEWGINWCIADRCNHALMLHAGVVEKGGRAIILPALPGSGKSTLTGALVGRGWRLLSDEFGVVRLEDGLVAPLVRPLALKNESIDIIRRFSPASIIGPSFPKTRKGTVAHLAPDAASAAGRHNPADPAAIVFPRFVSGADTTLLEMPKARAFAKLAGNSFNYEILGAAGFHAMGRLLERAACYHLEFSNLYEAVATLDDLCAKLLTNAEIDDGASLHAS